MANDHRLRLKIAFLINLVYDFKVLDLFITPLMKKLIVIVHSPSSWLHLPSWWLLELSSGVCTRSESVELVISAGSLGLL